jgi:predicted Zn-dependent protease
VASRAGPLGAWLQQSGLQLLRSAHSRDCEFEADELAVRLVIAAGFDPEGALSMLRRIESLGKNPGGSGPYFASHPPPLERIAALDPLCHPGAKA